MATFVPYKNYFYNQFHGMASLIVCSVGNEQSSPGFVHGPDVRTMYSLHFCLQGGGTLRSNNRVHKVETGDLMLVYPNIKVYPKADHQNPWEMCWVGFTGGDARLLTDAIGFSPLHPVIKTNPSSRARIEETFRDIYSCRGDRPAQIVGMTGKLYTCLSFLMSQTSHAFPHNPGREYIEPACEYIALNYAKKITIEDIATATGVSRSCLYRAFMANLSQSPIEYLSAYRIKVSCNLLEKGELSIKEVAYACGFSNALYYNRVFKKVMGFPPTNYLDHLSV
ncbi:MAG: AraC family transcriptional regulator [Sphaerochaeta sp.]|uniref:AraC family transcriptional regulator n=1 Tax=Sphaerochaeta sp. TaxID=1972642 RepID=UPI002FC944FB